MKGMIKTGCMIIFAGLFFVGCATTDPCVNILQAKPVEPGIPMNSVTIIDTSLYYEMVGATYCEGVRIAPTTAEAAAQQNSVARYKVTVEQMSSDVTHFLMWTAEPKLEVRKRMGIEVMLFLLVLTAMLYASKRKVWARVDH